MYIWYIYVYYVCILHIYIYINISSNTIVRPAPSPHHYIIEAEVHSNQQLWHWVLKAPSLWRWNSELNTCKFTKKWDTQTISSWSLICMYDYLIINLILSIDQWLIKNIILFLFGFLVSFCFYFLFCFFSFIDKWWVKRQ